MKEQITIDEGENKILVGDYHSEWNEKVDNDRFE